MGKNYGISLILIMMSVLSLAAGLWRLDIINDLRREYKIEIANPLKDSAVTSELRLPTAALFTFRSLAIDYLWIRADKLKIAGQYFDALHLARLICTLQPNLAAVWDFQAWNMAYNISYAMRTGPERWQWIMSAIKLLRDEGLVYNPHSLKLYRSLAWIFQHKIGGISDDYHRYYKERLAYEMMILLGPSVVTNEELTALRDSPRNWEELAQDPQVAEFAQKLIQLEPKFNNIEDMLAGLLDIREIILQGVLGYQRTEPKYSGDLRRFVLENVTSPALRKLDLFIRSRALRQQWKMEPGMMLKINNMYGPIDYENEDKHFSLDWRQPFPHAIYWGMQGLPYAKKKDVDETNLHRVVYQSLQGMFEYGFMQILAAAPPAEATARQPGQEILEPQQIIRLRLYNSQDLRMFPIAYQATLDLIKSYMDETGRVSGGIIAGSNNLGRSGVVDLYLAGHRKLALKYLDSLRERFPENTDYHVTLDNFVRNQMKLQISEVSPKYASNYIVDLLRDAYGRYAMGDDEQAVIRERWAQQVMQIVKEEYPEQEDKTSRLNLLDFGQLRWLAMQNFLNDPLVDQAIKELLLARLKINDPEMYDRVMQELQKPQEQRRDFSGQ